MFESPLAERTEPITLAIDTSTVVTVGVAQGNDILGSNSWPDPMAHAEQLVPLVRRTLEEASRSLSQVDRIVVGLGPGPYTGLRVGIATAQILAMAHNVELHGVCSLDVVAAQFVRECEAAQRECPVEFAVVSDARRRELYWARYSADSQRVGEAEVCLPADVPDLPAVGPGVTLYPEQLQVLDGPRSVDAGLLALIGWRLPSAGTEPLYLRRPDAAEPTRRKSVLPGQLLDRSRRRRER